jgi:hypothetical protein
MNNRKTTAWKVAKYFALYVGGMLIGYVVSYFIVSRIGYAEQDRTHGLCFYYSSPYSGGDEATHMLLERLYRPLQWLETLAGSKRRPCGSFPLRMKDRKTSRGVLDGFVRWGDRNY